MDLSQLPRHFVKISKYWFENSKTGEKIHINRITDHLPKPPINEQEIINKRWDLRY
jgi:hypothetical protein